MAMLKETDARTNRHGPLLTVTHFIMDIIKSYTGILLATFSKITYIFTYWGLLYKIYIDFRRVFLHEFNY